jgi:hypothetical protein
MIGMSFELVDSILKGLEKQEATTLIKNFLEGG